MINFLSAYFAVNKPLSPKENAIYKA